MPAYFRAQRTGDHLRAEADAEYGEPFADRSFQPAQLGGDVVQVIVIRALKPAICDDAAARRPIYRQFIALVETERAVRNSRPIKDRYNFPNV